jgi:hypothetical protein
MVKGQEMPAFNRVAKPARVEALPHVTYANGVELHLNGELARVRHLAHAHTARFIGIVYEGLKRP